MASLDPAIVPHVQHIRDALWRDGAATVMVGSGFSLNAEPLAPGARRFPLWDQLAHEMAKGIALDDGKPRDPLRLAQMYASTRGRMELDRLIERTVPDGEWRPGELHLRLLELPWADVFSTNYDTLLERAPVHRRYEIVRAPNDIPMRRQPRLVKLHGTLGTGQQLIATEEDYRGYPRKFPAFVNLVQGSVMETVFVLIGFAGDDPNFLEWTGWVRDVLGEQAPRIYLCGLLDASPADCALLAARSVTPVDLSRMFPPVSGVPQHRAALDWLLKAFESGRPVRAENWAPTEPINPPQTVVPLPPASSLTAFSLSPKATPEKGVETTATEFREIAKIWAEQRREYPGWHVAPNPIRDRVWHTTQRWRDLIFSRLDTLSIEEQLPLLRELCWRLELCLSPVFTNECDQIANCLERVDPFRGILGIPNAKVEEVAFHSKLSEPWRLLALHVLRTAREDLDESRFKTWYGRLSLVCNADTSLAGELAYEQALWHLNNLDLAAFRKTLDEWRPQARQPLEFLRLASCYAELGESQAATELASAAINGARVHGRTHEAISTEAWGCFLLRGLHSFGSEPEPMKEARERLAKAKEDGYDPWEIVRVIQNDLIDLRPKRRQGRQRVAGFDAGSIRETLNFGDSERLLMPAFRLMRLLERAPCPIYSGYLNFFATSAAHAAVWLEQAAPSWSLSTLLRCEASKEILQEHFHRAAVATLKPERVQLLCDVLLRVIGEEAGGASKKASGVPDDMVRRMAKTAMELLSRIAMRAPEATHRRLLDTCVAWLSSSEVANSFDFYDALRTLVARVVEALPEELLTKTVIGFLGTPMPGEGHFKPWHADHWPDAFAGLWNRVPKRPDDRGPRWAEDWRRILEGIRSEDQSLRSSAFERGHFLFSKDWLSTEEAEQLASALWSQVDAATELPKIQAGRRAWLLHSAQASQHGIDGKLRRRLLTAPFPTFRNEKGGIDMGRLTAAQNRLEDLCAVFSHPALADSAAVIQVLSEAEMTGVIEKIHSWWPSLIEILGNSNLRRLPFGGSTEKLGQVVTGFLGDVLMLNLPREHPHIPQIERMLGDLESAGISTQAALLGRLFHRPDILPSVRDDLERVLVGKDETKLRLALSELGDWSRAARAMLVPPIPVVLVERVVGKFGLRMPPCLDSAAKCLVTWIENDFELLNGDQRDWLLSGLEQIARETDPSVISDAYGKDVVDGVEVAEALHLRAWAGVLASAFNEAFMAVNLDVPPVLGRWREICANDPLPEVRQAWGIRRGA